VRRAARRADARAAPHPQERVLEVAPSVVILSGGPNSVHEAGSPTVPAGFFEWAAAAKVPVLGICYGMQLLVQRLGGEVAPAGQAAQSPCRAANVPRGRARTRARRRRRRAGGGGANAR
jgi:GMP synthase-like glutamine amidotransferase